MKKTVLALASLMFLSGCKEDIQPIAVPLTSQITGVPAPCEDLTYQGFPRKEPIEDNTFFICRPGYALNLDPEEKVAQWVVQRLRASELASPDAVLSIDEVRPDPLLPVLAQAQRDDYIATGYLRTPFAPKFDYIYDDVLYSHVDYLSNAFPQHEGMQGALSILEQNVRRWAQERGEVYVVTGPIYHNGRSLGWVGTADSNYSVGEQAREGKVSVPTHVYKIILDAQTNESIAFVLPNALIEEPYQSLPTMITTVQQIEALTSIRFFPILNSADPVKLQFNPAAWNLLDYPYERRSTVVLQTTGANTQ